ncbi:hypothetical protein DMN91_009446 [Ooceraea biroi]|nr:hypothetical protein X777_11894 [Ooceraea biroi]RLU19088.1 hypothetical protein DMN91_009446 [Ooceraea biroi]
MKQEKPEGQDKICRTQPQEKDAASKSTNDDVQRAIEGLKEIPDEELQEFLDDEDFMEGLDVVDAWEGDEEKNKVKVEQDTAVDPVRQEEKPPRERDRAKTTKGLSDSREKPRREERKRDELRRDPTKSTKDIERDKMRTKRDTESKLLAEKEKAIKHLLDSDNVVPPGTESEAIQNIKEEQNRERAQREGQGRGREHHRRRSADRYGGRQSPPRRRSPDRLRPSPPVHRRRSPFPLSPERRRSPLVHRNSSDRHKSPFRYSPTRRKNSPRYFDRRSPVVSSPERRRSPRLPSWERRSSVDRRWSPERHRRRDTHERRRSRSRDRRSRSTERLRRRSSRSPVGRRYSPRRRSRTRSRSPEKRARKRSPFIHELARQLRNEAMMPSGVVNTGGYAPPPATVEGIAPLLNAPMYQQEGEPRPPPPQPQPAPPPPPPPPVASFHPHQSGPLPPPPPLPGGPPFMGFESMSAMPPMTFHEPMAPHSIPPVEYSSGPVMYNQSNNTAPVQQAPPQPVIHPPLLPASLPVPSPQPVPAPVMDHVQMPYKALNVPPIQAPLMHQFEATANSKPSHAAMPATSSQIYKERGSTSYSAEFHALREERLKTPEPPVISKPKQFEKTSLSSLLEASVSAKDPSNIPMLYPGFKPEIIRYCEQALCQLPLEDPRLKMKGRFFYDRNEENSERTEPVDHMSNSILLQKSKTRIYWEECSTEQQVPLSKAPTAQMHQKICQTDEVETETKGVQARVATSDFESQVYPHDLDHVQVKEEKRPIMDRLDWSVRETYDYAPRYREMEDLRWSLSSSSRRNYRQESPEHSRASEHEHLDLIDHGSRNLRESPAHSRESFSGHRMREHYSHARYSPDPYHRRSMERDEFHDKRSDHSRGESPMDLEEESDDELVSGFTLQRGSDWHGRGKPMRGKSYNPRGKHMGGRPYRGRGGYRGGKF